MKGFQMPIYLPKQIVPLSPTVEHPLFFLAGPVRGGGDWQARMSQYILNCEPSAHIACPTRWVDDHIMSSHFHQPYSQAENRQLVWERHYLKQAGLLESVPGCVIFWLGAEDGDNPHPGPQPYAMDTRRELGKFTAYAEVMNTRVVVGGDRSFFGLSVILFELQAALGEKFSFYESMEETATQAFAVARK